MIRTNKPDRRFLKWEKKKEIESAIFKARQEEQYARKRKDAGYLETPARPV